MTENIRLDFSVVPIKHRVKVGPLTILSLFSKLVSKSVSQWVSKWVSQSVSPVSKRVSM